MVCMPREVIPVTYLHCLTTPNYYVENTMNVYTDYYSYRRNMLIGVGYDLLLRKHWYIGFSVQYGF